MNAKGGNADKGREGVKNLQFFQDVFYARPLGGESPLFYYSDPKVGVKVVKLGGQIFKQNSVLCAE